MWIDEANSVLISQESPGHILESLSVDGNPPLYYLLLHGWIEVLGTSELVVRGLSVVCGIALVAIVFLAGRSWFGLMAGFFSALLVALSPLHVYYSREALMYALMAVLGLLCAVALDRLLRRRTAVSFGLLTLLLAATAYTHNYGLFLLPGVALAGLAARDGRLRGLVLASCASIAALVLVAPWLPVVVRQAGTGVGDWIPPLFTQETDRFLPGLGGEMLRPLAGLLRTLEVMAPGAPYPSYLRKLPGESFLGALPLLLMLLALVAGIVPGRKSRAKNGASTGGEDRVDRGLLLLLCALGPIALPLLYSCLVKPIYLVGRYEMISLGMVALLAGRGMVRIASLPRSVPARRTLSGVLTTILVGLSLLSLVPYLALPNPLPPHARVLARHLEEKGRQGDIILFCEVTRATTEYALEREGAAGRFVLHSFPEDAGLHRGWYDPKEYEDEREALDREALDLVRELRKQMTPGRRLFLLYEGRWPDLHSVLLRELVRAFGNWRPRLSRVGEGLYTFET